MFKIDDLQWAKIKEWKAEQNAKVKARQEKDPQFVEDHGGMLPYYGASGGAYTYSFTPTTIGCVVKVKNSVTGDELDVSDYGSW
jgi:hypothetical protein